MRPKPGVALEDHLSALKKMQGDFQQAKKVVIIGAGPVGLEIAGVSWFPSEYDLGSNAERFIFFASDVGHQGPR